MRTLVLMLGFVVALTWPTGTEEAQVEAGYTAYGHGAQSCGEWTRRQRASPRIGWLDGHIWVSGFVSGASFVARTASGEQLARTDSAAMVAWIDNYCLATPLDNLAGASEALTEELARRGQ